MPAIDRNSTFSALPPVWPEEILTQIQAELSLSPRKLVVLDDDPTGTQTVYGIAVVTRWDVATLRSELGRPAKGFYILTNSRALTGPAARERNLEIAQNLRQAAQEIAQEFTVASRSDSTLRGHYPLETDTLSEICGPFDVTLIAPYFESGGRFTIGDTHYVAEGDHLVPAAETPFARDASFGYRNSNLRLWVEEKTAGRVRASDVLSLSLDLIRGGGPRAVTEALLAAPAGTVVIVNAAAQRDIEVVALATLRAEAAGRRLIFRTAASLVAARLGIAPQPLLAADTLTLLTKTGGLVVAGSYVPKTTEQLLRLRTTHRLHVVELAVEALIDPARVDAAVSAAIRQVNDALAAAQDTLVFTSRMLVTADSIEGNLAIGGKVSRALIDVVRGITVIPRFLIAKGGITASDIATSGLNVHRALVVGQLLPGVPVWQLGPESKFPGLHFVVFPGNVGGPDALAEAVQRLAGVD